VHSFRQNCGYAYVCIWRPPWLIVALQQTDLQTASFSARCHKADGPASCRDWARYWWDVLQWCLRSSIHLLLITYNSSYKYITQAVTWLLEKTTKLPAGPEMPWLGVFERGVTGSDAHRASLAMFDVLSCWLRCCIDLASFSYLTQSLSTDNGAGANVVFLCS